MSTSQDILSRFDPKTAWQPYFPNPLDPWDQRKVAHLYRRAAFGASWPMLEVGLAGQPRDLVARLRGGGADQDRFEAEVERLETGALESGEVSQLKAIWLYRMIHSPHPLRERMTLFWHNHFATSNAKVNNVRAMARQNELLRRYALGHFDTLLQEMTLDPAMLIWLDSNQNKKGQPNENYGRELFELFSLGVGNYTETDIQEAARALTGWSVDQGRVEYNPDEHDTGLKTVLGQTGRWTAGDVVRIALNQPACSLFLVRKIFREFISETAEPSDELLQPLADGFRSRNYDIGWLMETVLSSWVFYSPVAIFQRVKSPVEFAVGTVRSLEGTASPLQLANMCDRLGQSLFYPPGVKGWDGGSTWLNSTTILHRQNLAFDFCQGSGEAAGVDPARLIEEHHIQGPEATAQFFLELFYQNRDHRALPEIVAHLKQQQSAAGRFESARVTAARLARSAALLALTLPEYQLG